MNQKQLGEALDISATDMAVTPDCRVECGSIEETAVYGDRTHRPAVTRALR